MTTQMAYLLCESPLSIDEWDSWDGSVSQNRTLIKINHIISCNTINKVTLSTSIIRSNIYHRMTIIKEMPSKAK